jgi:hypothetical protein
VGQKAAASAALAGFSVPDSAKILIGEVESVELSEAFAHEKLSPVLAMYKVRDFNNALDKAEVLVRDGGYGHTAALYVNAVSGKLRKCAGLTFPFLYYILIVGTRCRLRGGGKGVLLCRKRGCLKIRLYLRRRRKGALSCKKRYTELLSRRPRLQGTWML